MDEIDFHVIDLAVDQRFRLTAWTVDAGEDFQLIAYRFAPIGQVHADRQTLE